MYDDEYPTCAKTYATFRVYPGNMDPTSVSERLGIEPTRSLTKGELAEGSFGSPKIASINAWFLGSRGEVESKDVRRHLDWLLDALTPKAEAIRALHKAGCKMDIFCYWLSRSGHGGPIISPVQMARFAELNLALGFDFYGPFEEAGG